MFTYFRERTFFYLENIILLENQAYEITIDLQGISLLDLFGENDQKLNLIRATYKEILITSRGDLLKIKGEEIEAIRVSEIFETMIAMQQKHGEITFQMVQELLKGENTFENKLSVKNPSNIILHGRNSKPIIAKTKNQKKMVEYCDENDILFAIGPAGTGKTYTAVALAVRALKNKLVKKIILTRPAVEAGENLGFLPGGLEDKIDPYLRPLYDALDDMLPMEKMTYFTTNRIIEVAPLAFMRGRTLDNAFIILDEAQNTTDLQIKMCLTRLGPNAKCIITGDITQVDLPRSQKSGLPKALRILENIDGIGILHLDTQDVVRHRLVKAIIKAYDKDDLDHEQEKNTK